MENDEKYVDGNFVRNMGGRNDGGCSVPLVDWMGIDILRKIKYNVINIYTNSISKRDEDDLL